MRRIGIVALGLVLVGCASNNPYPVNISGNYYMVEDRDCDLYRLHNTEKLIQCMDANQKVTGYRRAMSNQELYVYQSNQMIAAQRSAQVNADIDAQNQALLNQSYPTMQTPRVTPITPPGGNQVRCLSTGFYTNCR